VFKSRSALESFRARPDAEGGAGPRSLRLGEIVGTPLIQLGAYPGGAAGLKAAVLPILGEALPESSNRAATTGAQFIMRIAPDQYWIVGGAPKLDARLRNSIPSEVGCVTVLDGARTRLSIEGQAARRLLSRLVSIDLHPNNFPIDGFAQTGIHHVGGLLLRVGENCYEFFALRTFAASIWEVLLDAARPFGYEIFLPETKT
jgi:heterotetrameric sarcosine oxidase gamma subunit